MKVLNSLDLDDADILSGLILSQIVANVAHQ